MLLLFDDETSNIFSMIKYFVIAHSAVFSSLVKSDKSFIAIIRKETRAIEQSRENFEIFSFFISNEITTDASLTTYGFLLSIAVAL
jgi:hypothetical protein